MPDGIETSAWAGALDIESESWQAPMTLQLSARATLNECRRCIVAVKNSALSHQHGAHMSRQALRVSYLRRPNCKSFS
jgi:hypothetical protein